MAAAADWAHLPPEIVLSIAGKLEFFHDMIRLQAVCVWWAWALGKTCGDRPLPLPPPPDGHLFRRFVLMTIPNAAGEDTDVLTYLSLSENRRYTISSLPQITDRRVMGSSPDGWLVTVDLLLTPRLLNPFTRQELPLPSLLTLPDDLFVAAYTYDGMISKFWYKDDGVEDNLDGLISIKSFRDMMVRKIILPNSSPLNGGIAIAVITFDVECAYLAFASVGDKAWLPGPNLEKNFDLFEDVIYNQVDGKFYAVTNLGAIFILECKDKSWEVLSMVSRPINMDMSDYIRRYIFFSSGDLLQVVRHWHHLDDLYSFISDDIEIFRFDQLSTEEEELPYTPQTNFRNLSTYASCWVPVKDLGDRSLFLGPNHSFSLHCDPHHELGLIKRNRVYFGDDNYYQGRRREKSLADIGVLNLETNMVEPFFPSDCLVNWPPPVFFMSTHMKWDIAL